ncbi:MAG TPA: molybdenum cofactor biosynthesis protein MoaE, partial [Ktedonobacterales bacterium]|nr:molybdenum cofactor biosynthesis protein MoaE [Ktedonobacterales bacterium]
MTSLIQITREPLNRPAIDAIVREVWHAGAGGIVTFEGTVRDHARGKRVRYLEYDAYPEMAEQEMAKIAREVERRWQTDRVALVHRIG